jgi:hypothetical protein
MATVPRSVAAGWVRELASTAATLLQAPGHRH